MLIIPDLFTPYLEGTERGRQANWDDLNQYNRVQAGQLQNMLDLATFSPRVNAQYDAETAAKLRNQLALDTHDYDVSLGYSRARGNQLALEGAEAAHPGNLAAQTALSGAWQRGAPAYSQAQVDALIAEARNRAGYNSGATPGAGAVPGIPNLGAAITPPAGLSGAPATTPAAAATVPSHPQAGSNARQQFPQIQIPPQYLNSPDDAGIMGSVLRPQQGIQPGNGMFAGIIENSSTRNLADNSSPSYSAQRDELYQLGYTPELAAALQPDSWATLAGNQIAYRDANGDYWGVIVGNNGTLQGAYRVVMPTM